MIKKQDITIDAYIKTFPEEIQTILEKIRQTIHKAAPEAEEMISYGMPTFTLNGKKLIYFAGWKTHVGFYHIPAGDAAFQKEIAPYINDKGAVLLPLNQPMPYELIEKIVKFQIKESF